LSNAGTVTIGSGTALASGSYTQRGGTTTLAGGALSSTVNNQGGTPAGNGTVTGNVTSGGTVAPGTSTAPGKITINGSYTQTSAGALAEKIAVRNVPGTDYDQLVVTARRRHLLASTPAVSLPFFGKLFAAP
jgi:hypothetical protein